MEKENAEKLVQESLARENSQDQDRQSGGGEDRGKAPEQKPKVHIATFRGIPLDLHQSVKDVANDLGISPGELARYFLEQGLAQVEAGEDNVKPTFVPGGYTLYPDEKKAESSRPRRKRSKQLQKPRSYYGVPRDVVRAVLEQSQSLGVTQGELARHLLERGVERYRSGDLTIEPVPVQQIATLYPKDLGGTGKSGGK